MDIMMVLASMCLVFGLIGFFAAVRNRAEERRSTERKGLQVPLAPVVVVGLSLVCLPLAAQEVVHAQTGKVVAVNSASKTLVLKLADGSTEIFHDVPSHEPDLSLDKSVRAKTVPVASFNKVGANVVVLYFGYDNPTAVAVKELGADAPKKSSGNVSNFDRHDHSLTLKTDAAEQKLVLTEDTIVDTNDGVVKLANYKPSKGEHLSCFTSPNTETALLVVPQ